MSVTIGEIKAVYGMDISDFLSASRKVTSGLDSLRKANQDLASFMMGPFQAVEAGFRLIGKSVDLAASAFKSTVQPAAQFQTALKNVSTLVDTSVINMDAFAQGIMALPAELGDATTNVNALYQAISAGAAPAEAMQLVANSAIAAKAGLSDTFTAVDAGTSVMSGFGMELSRSSEVFDKMFTTVKLGKTTFNELASSVGPLASMFNSAGISIDEMFASISAGTMTGMETKQVIASLQQAVANIIKPTADAAKVAEELGIDFSATALKTKGLKGFLEELQTATGGNIEQMSKFFGSVEALRVVLPLTGSQAQKFADDLLAMRESEGAAEAAFKKMADSAQIGLDALVVNYGKLRTSVGEAIIGSQGFADVLTELNNALESTREFVKDNQDLIGGLSDALSDLVRTSLRYTIEAFGLLSQAVRAVGGTWREMRISDVESEIKGLNKELSEMTKSLHWWEKGQHSEDYRAKRAKELKLEIEALERRLKSMTVQQMEAAGANASWNEGIQKIINDLEKERSILDDTSAAVNEHSADVNKTKDVYSELSGMTDGLLAFYGEGTEKTKTLTEETNNLADAVKKTNEAYSQLEEMTDGLLAFYDAGIVSEGELTDAMMEAREMRKKQFKEQEEQLREATLQYGSFSDGVKLAHQDMLESQLTWSRAGLEMFGETTAAMAGVFQNVFFDFFTGELKSAEDYFRSFVNNILASFTQLMAQMAAQNLMGSIFGGGGGLGTTLFSGGTTAAGATAGTSLFGGGGAAAPAAAAGGIGIVPVLIAGIGAVGHYQLSMVAGEKIGEQVFGYDDLQTEMAGKLGAGGWAGGLGAQQLYGSSMLGGGAMLGPAGFALGVALPDILDRLGLGGKNDFTKLLGMGGSETRGSQELGAFDEFLDALGLSGTSRSGWSGVFTKEGGLRDEFSEYSAIADTMLSTMDLMRQEFGFTNATAQEMASIIFNAFQSSGVSIEEATNWLGELARGMAQTSDSSQGFFDQYQELGTWKQQMAEVLSYVEQMQAEFSELSSAEDLEKWQRGMDLLERALEGDMGGLAKFKTLFNISDEVEELEDAAEENTKENAVEKATDKVIDNIADTSSMAFDLEIRIKPSVAGITNADENALAGLVVDWIQDNTGRLQDEIGNQIMRQLKKEGLVV